jgi:spore coat protein CotH
MTCLVVGMRRRSFVRSVVLTSVVAMVAAASCSGDDAPYAVDGGELDGQVGADAGILDATVPDVSLDAPRDTSAPRDATDDGPNDATVDAEAGLDASLEGGADASADASDASLDAADAAPEIDIYDPALVPQFELTLDAAALAILSNPSTVEADRKAWAHGTLRYGGEVYPDIGVRRKGSSTFRALPQKAAFKLRFDKYGGPKFHGLREITLNNAMSDGTFLVERLAYHVFRGLGLPAPRCNSATLLINGADYGVYVNVEAPDKVLMARLFGANAQSLYEVAYGSSWMGGEDAGFEEEVGDGTKSDLQPLFADVRAAQPATLLSDVSAHLETGRFVTFAAAEAVTGHIDGYGFGIWGSHNYFMASEKNGKFTLLPWSLDLTFSNNNGVVNVTQPKPANPSGAGTTLLQRCKTSPTCWPAYVAEVRRATTAYEGMGLLGLAQAWHAQIDARVLVDTKKELTNAAYAGETTKLMTWITNRPSVVRTQLGP